MSDPVGYLQGMDAMICRACDTRKRLDAEVAELRNRRDDLLRSNNEFEQRYRDAKARALAAETLANEAIHRLHLTLNLAYDAAKFAPDVTSIPDEWHERHRDVRTWVDNQPLPNQNTAREITQERERGNRLQLLWKQEIVKRSKLLDQLESVLAELRKLKAERDGKPAETHSRAANDSEHAERVTLNQLESMTPGELSDIDISHEQYLRCKINSGEIGSFAAEWAINEIDRLRSIKARQSIANANDILYIRDEVLEEVAKHWESQAHSKFRTWFPQIAPAVAAEVRAMKGRQS